MLNKKCKICNHLLNIENFHFFYKKKANADTVKVFYNSCKNCRNVARLKNRNIPKNKYSEYKRSAARKKLSFNLTFSEFQTFENANCYYCGDKTEGIGLDRVDNDLGYFKDNVVACCHKCNSFKHVYDIDEFLAHINKIFDNQQRMRNGK